MRVLMRVDTNVPVKNGRVVDGDRGRLARILPEIEAFAKKGARVIILSHRGRPGGKYVEILSNQPIAKRAGQYLKGRVSFFEASHGKKVEARIENMGPGEVLWLENVRFDSREEKNSAALGKAYAALADVYVNNAFGVSHRKHASVHAVTNYIPSYAGALILEELKELSKSPKHPFVLVMGGIKLETKLPVLKKLAPQADVVLLGGGIALAFAAAVLGIKLQPVGRSLSYSDIVLANAFFKTCADKIHLPVDVKIGTSLTSGFVKNRLLEECQGGEQVFDIGKETIRQYRALLQGAKTVVWNGSMGVLEHSGGVKGTRAIAKSITSLRTARTILGGGDTVSFVERSGHVNGFTFVSTGGGAMLEFLAGKKLPGLEVLKK